MADSRPKVALVYDSRSITPFEVAEAARPECRLIWLLDYTDPMLSPLLPLVRRLGSVIDIAGRTHAEVIAELAADPPDGVITFAERQMGLAAAIAVEYGLAFFSPATADLLTNKYEQRVALARAGVPGPRFWALPAGADADTTRRLASQLPYPVVLKPQRGTGSANTSLVLNGESFLRLLDDAAGEPADMLVEELLVEARPAGEERFGRTFMVDSLVSNGVAHHFVVCGHFIPAPPFRGAGSFAPADLDDAQTAVVLETVDAALAALGIKQGFTDTDVILTPDGPRVMEVNGRIGGEVHTLVELAGAPPLLPAALRFAIGAGPVEIARLETRSVAFAVNLHAPMEARRLLTLSGLDAVGQLPGVTRVVRYRQDGDPVDWRHGTMSRVVTTYGVASDHDNLRELHAQIERAIVVEYELGGPVG